MKQLLFILTLLTTSVSMAQIQFWADNFDSAPTSGTRTPEENGGVGGPPMTSYFRLTDGSTVSQIVPFTGKEGTSYWAGEDHNALGTGFTASMAQGAGVDDPLNELSITWNGINISGKTGLSFRGLLAANNTSSSWDTKNALCDGLATTNTDYIIVQYRIDGGAWTDLIRFFNKGGVSNPSIKSLFEDTDGDGCGDGTGLTNAFGEFIKSIPGTGTTLDLRLNVYSEGNNEEWGIDNFRLFETAACTAPTITANPPNRVICAGNNTTFTSNASGVTAFQWQENSGSGFVDIINGGVYSNATTNTLTITGATAGMSGYLYRCRAINGSASCFTNTNQATLTVSSINTSSAAQTNVACNGGNTGAASVSPSGGIAPYTYSWSPSGGTASIATGLAAGAYTVTVFDNIGCSATRNFTITQPPVLNGSTVVTNVICNGTSTGAINLTPSGGTPGYTFNWTAGPTTEDRTGLAAGTYSVTITDANLCTRNITGITVTQPTAVSGTTVVTNVACFGGTTGTINLTPTGGVGPYTFNWVAGPTSEDRTGLAAGNYSVTITDANLCTGTVNVTVTQPTAITLTPAAQTNISCNGGTNGAASVNAASGGAGGYTYNWTPGNPTGDGTVSVSGLTALTYTCTATDANGCTASQNFTITQPTAITLNAATQTNVACNGGTTGAASVSPATGGAGGFTYNWTPGNPTGDGTVSVSGLTAQTYTCTATDANGCTAARNFTITQPTAISATLSSTPSTCSASTGTATVSALSGGAGGYAYNWSPGTPSGDGTATITGLNPGTWTCLITDANGCSISPSTTVTGASAPTLTAAAQTNISCFGGSNGSASVNVATGGTAPYTYDWTPGNPSGDGTTSVSGLTAGTWTCTVTDAGGCQASVIFNLTQPTAISGTTVVTNVACFGGTTGAINLTPSGGVGPYTFNWGSGITTEDRTGLTAGTYSVTIMDANLCTGTVNVSVTQPASAVSGTTVVTNVACFGGSNGAINLTPTGGVGGYTFNWGGGPTSEDRISLTAGTYSVTISDLNGCTGTVNATVTQPTAAVSGTTVVTNVACFSGTTGAINLTPTGGVGPYTFNWAAGPTTEDRISLTAGIYSVTISDLNGCTGTVNATVTQPTAAVSGTTVVTNVACFGGTTGAINLTPTGGVGGYTFNWGSGIISEDRTGLTAGSYSVTIMDANGCTGIVNATVTEPTAIAVASTSNTSVSCFGGSNGTASISTPTGGTGAYTYNWTPGNPVGDGTTSISGLIAGTWTCTITDANGCTNVQNVTVTQPTAIVLTAAGQSNITCAGGANGTASVNPASGGVGTFAYDWTPGTPTGDGTTAISGLTPGTWTCTVTDLNGCTASQAFTITQPAVLATTSTVTACNSYTLNGQTYTTSGTYTQLLTSVNGCDSTVTLNLTVNYSSTASMSATACSSYTLNGQTYTASGTYVQNLTNVAGCDSTLTLNLIINQPSASSITQASCYAYTLNGQTYTASGTYTQTLTNAIGCDSTITLNLTIFNATSSNLTITACDSYTLGNQVYTASGTYVQTISNVGGCDSVVTLNLTITQSSASSFTDAACEFYNWNGTSYNASGTYTQTFTNAAGCDSVVTLNLTINMPYENTTAITACDSYVWNGQTYTTSGMYMVTNPNMNGCDSTEHLNLTIVASPTAGIEVLDPIILHATGTGTYQWIDCTTGQALAGETDQNLVATYNGSFAVVVSNGNCSDTSACEVINTIGLSENNGIVAIQMVPNPTSNNVTITWTSVEDDASIVILDAHGKEVLATPNFKSGQTLSVAQFETGMYLVVIKTASNQTIERLIKQ